MLKNRSFTALVYKADNAFYQDGQYQLIYCNHTFIGLMGINTQGEIVPLPETRVASPAVVPSALVPPGTINPSDIAFGDAGFKAVVQVKDEVMQATYWVDEDSYYANVVSCNPTSHN